MRGKVGVFRAVSPFYGDFPLFGDEDVVRALRAAAAP